MTPRTFDDQLRTLIRQEPFRPFTVVFNDGKKIGVDVPHAIAFNNGGGGYIQPDFEVIFFDCEEVDAILPETAEVVT